MASSIPSNKIALARASAPHKLLLKFELPPSEATKRARFVEVKTISSQRWEAESVSWLGRLAGLAAPQPGHLSGSEAIPGASIHAFRVVGAVLPHVAIPVDDNSRTIFVWWRVGLVGDGEDAAEDATKDPTSIAASGLFAAESCGLDASETATVEWSSWSACGEVRVPTTDEAVRRAQEMEQELLSRPRSARTGGVEAILTRTEAELVDTRRQLQDLAHRNQLAAATLRRLRDEKLQALKQSETMTDQLNKAMSDAEQARAEAAQAKAEATAALEQAAAAAQLQLTEAHSQAAQAREEASLAQSQLAQALADATKAMADAAEARRIADKAIEAKEEAQVLHQAAERALECARSDLEAACRVSSPKAWEADEASPGTGVAAGFPESKEAESPDRPRSGLLRALEQELRKERAARESAEQRCAALQSAFRVMARNLPPDDD